MYIIEKQGAAAPNLLLLYKSITGGSKEESKMTTVHLLGQFLI